MSSSTGDGPHHEHGHVLVPVMTRREILLAGGAGLGAWLLAACSGRGSGPDPVYGTSVPGSTSPEPSTTTDVAATADASVAPPTTGGARATTSSSPPATTVAEGSGDLVMPDGFDEFASTVRVTRDGQWWLVESNGLPAHGMMTGITSWQQQVPVAQPYSGANGWRIPVAPVMSANPVSGRTALYRGAIALAANGVPIFNALNNRGDDAFLAGELDEWGGHCGRADDYHYHVAPLHLTDSVGHDKPIAWALDGFPVLGEREPDGSSVRNLDEYNGHSHGRLGYHYHGTRTYPYINGGLRGVVTVSGDQVEPQPRTEPFRPAGEPLRGAVITSFTSPSSNNFVLTYATGGRTGEVAYSVSSSSVSFVFTSPDGAVTTETYARRG